MTVELYAVALVLTGSHVHKREYSKLLRDPIKLHVSQNQLLSYPLSFSRIIIHRSAGILLPTNQAAGAGISNSSIVFSNFSNTATTSGNATSSTAAGCHFGF